MTTIATNEVFDLTESSIPNAVIEQMFFRVANESQMTTYDNYTDRPNEISLKTAYASKICKQAMTILISYYERKQGKIFQLPS